MLSKKFFFSIIIFFLSLNPAYADNLKDAVLMKTTDKNAVCNNGEQSTFVLSKSNSKNWFVYFQGGGVNYDLRIKKQDGWPDLVWPAKLIKINTYAFTSRVALLNEFDNVCEIPGRVTYIGIDAFAGVWIKKLILKEGLKVIKDGAFAGKIGTNFGGGNANLDQPLLKIPDSVTEMSATLGTAITVANYGGDFYHGPNVSAYDISNGIGKSANTAPFKKNYLFPFYAEAKLLHLTMEPIGFLPFTRSPDNTHWPTKDLTLPIRSFWSSKSYILS